jgi:hypothetical protein
VAREPINLGRIDRWQKIASVSQHRAVVALTPVRVAFLIVLALGLVATPDVSYTQAGKIWRLSPSALVLHRPEARRRRRSSGVSSASLATSRNGTPVDGPSFDRGDWNAVHS